MNEGEIVLPYSQWQVDSKEIKSAFKRDLSQLRQHLDWIAQDVLQFNNLVRSKAQTQIEKRRQRLLEDRDLVASLGFPLRRRNDDVIPTVIPEIRRKISIPQPSTATSSSAELFLREQEYNDILSLLHHMSLVMERSPKTFTQLGEEDIRTFFLVMLNAVYEGQATGETFNVEGKTDILIRSEGKNIFIAECKIWDGAKTLTGAIDQLLSYVSWRETKTAILIFSRKKNFSSVLEQISSTVEKHPNYKYKVDSRDENEFRFKFNHRDDENRELFMTVLAFDIPQ